ncbi:hypothetical protein VQ071_27750 [Cohnella sp. 56]
MHALQLYDETIGFLADSDDLRIGEPIELGGHLAQSALQLLETTD